MRRALWLAGVCVLASVALSDAARIGGGGSGGGGVAGLDANFDVNPTINAATTGTPFRVGDGSSAATDICIGTDGTLGGVVKPCADTNTRAYVWTNFTWCLYDVEGTSCMETFDPDAASTLLMYQYTANYRPLVGGWMGAGGLSTDGAQCATPAEVTINSGPKLYTIICTDNNSSTIYGSFQSPLNWDAGTLIFEQVVIQTAADTNALNGDLSAQCRGGAEAPSSTWGTAVAIDGNVTGSNQNNAFTSGAVTPAGTCTAGDMVYWRYVVDATGTTTAMATLHILGFTPRLRVVSRSQ